MPTQVIFDADFGDGSRFLNAWDARPENTRLHYLAVLTQPILPADLSHAGITDAMMQKAKALAQVWPPMVAGFHRLELDGGQIVLTLMLAPLEKCLAQLDARVDVFWLGDLNAAGSKALPLNFVRNVRRLAAPLAILNINTPAELLNETQLGLQQAGFKCINRTAIDDKSVHINAHYLPRWPVAPLHPPRAQRHAVVIGAGLAGCAAAQELTRRGWQISLVERHAKPACEASGNLAGIFMPLLSQDDNLTARLTRVAYLTALANWRQMGSDFPGEFCGVLQLAQRDKDTDNEGDNNDAAAHESVQRRIARRWQYPADFAQWLEAPRASDLAGTPMPAGGWHFPHGGWVQPAVLCELMLASCGEKLNRLFHHQAISAQRRDGQWQIYSSDGSLIAQAPVIIFANGQQTGQQDTQLAQTAQLPLRSVRGQVSHFDAATVLNTRQAATQMAKQKRIGLPHMVLCREGYITPPSHGQFSVGASYDLDQDTQLRTDSHAGNLARLRQILPALADHLTDAQRHQPMAGRVGFRSVTPDRLPLVGALPDFALERIGQTRRPEQLSDLARLPDAYVLLGYASRGLIWAPLAARLLAAQLDGEALPLERELAAALDPGRFLLQRYRQAQ